MIPITPLLSMDGNNHLKMNEQGNWRVAGLSAEVGDYFGELIEKHSLKI
jgi:hypothetical protein